MVKAFVSLVSLVLMAAPVVVDAQPADVVGVRAQGMGGAFTAVADDATASWWNPAGMAGGAWVLGDRKRLKQVFANLLSNAVKYNRPGGRVEIDVGALHDGRRVFSVRDTGRGFSAAQLQQLYQPFTRFAREGEVIEGTGIGLVITRRLVELMDGRIEVESIEGQGATSTVILPRHGKPAAPPQEAERASG